MKFWEVLIRIIEFITPAFMRRILSDRHERLKKFFEEKDRIKKSECSYRVKEIQLNSAVAALTGTRSTNNEEFDYFVDNFDPSYFENDYWTFVRFRGAFIVEKNEIDEIKAIKINQIESIKLITLNLLIVFMLILVPATLYLGRKGFYQAYNKELGIPVDVLNIAYTVVCFICFITIAKVFYDWSLWKSLKRQIKQKYGKES